MKHLTFRLLFLLCLHILSLSIFAQKHFTLAVKLPQTIHSEKVEAWLNNGKETKRILPQSLTDREMLLKGDYCSQYAAVTLQYPAEGNTKGYAKEFFVGEKPAAIIFNPKHSADSLFSHYSLQNVVDFEEEKQQMNNYTAVERNKAMDFENQYGNALFSGNDTAIRNRYFKILMPELGRKKLEYILLHLNSYYAFYSFRTDVAKPNIVSWDSLQSVFQTFPDMFKYSDEGNYLNAFLHSRQLLNGSADAVDFTSKDIHKNKVSLSQFEGSKYVLLHFWATWCTPCMKELPALKQISEQFGENGLQIISIALKSNEADYGKVIKKYQLNWIHIYNDIDLLNSYGNQPTPRICMIDKTGKLVYDTIGTGDNDDFQLTGLKEKLKMVLHK